VEAARERIKLPFLGENELKGIANVIYRLDDIVRKPIRRPRAPKVKPCFGWLALMLELLPPNLHRHLLQVRSFDLARR
jgi:hypothetical protein